MLEGFDFFYYKRLFCYEEVLRLLIKIYSTIINAFGFLLKKSIAVKKNNIMFEIHCNYNVILSLLRKLKKETSKIKEKI